MADAVDGKGPPPPELELYWNCQRYNTQPDSGAMLDQDYGLITRMNTLDGIYTSLDQWRNAKGDAIHRLSSRTRAYIAYLIELGIGVGLDG